MTSLEKLLHRIKQHKSSGKKVLSVDYIIKTIESDIEKEAHRANFGRGSVG